MILKGTHVSVESLTTYWAQKQSNAGMGVYAITFCCTENPQKQCHPYFPNGRGLAQPGLFQEQFAKQK